MMGQFKAFSPIIYKVPLFVFKGQLIPQGKVLINACGLIMWPFRAIRKKLYFQTKKKHKVVFYSIASESIS